VTSRKISRRAVLGAGLAAGAGVALDRAVQSAPSADADADGAAAAPAGAAGPLARRIAFEGRHQAGILTPRPDHATIVAFDAFAARRGDVVDAVATLSDRARALTQGHPTLLGAAGGEGPTPESGILGVRVPPDALTITIGFGASLFDDRYGFAARKPAGLTTMPAFPDDDLDPAACHGDLVVQLCAHTEETVINALRDLMRATRGALAVRWKVDGFLPNASREGGAGRNLLGFKDGTANPDAADEKLMNDLVWTPDGGTFGVVRVIRNRVEFWDRVGRPEQELMIGRDKARGAPLGRPAERSDPDYASDPDGSRIPLDAHMRLARPRTAKTESQRILRRGYNYSRGIDQAGQLDMGLIFVAFNRSIETQFAKVQQRLAGEPLVDYIKPTGGGYFYMPRGARNSQEWVGADLLV
jgi:deferrochelatase/peroxidase EfeB